MIARSLGQHGDVRHEYGARQFVGIREAMRANCVPQEAAQTAMVSGLALRFDGPVATLTFGRPKRLNAIDQATWRALPTRIMDAVTRGETRVIVLRGADGNFAAGADISEFETVFADRSSTLSYLDEMAAATAAIEQAEVPVIALIEGLCIGAGVAVALACDIRLAAHDATFAVTPAKLGLMYSLADTKRLTDAIGFSAAKDLLFTGRKIDAPRAAMLGLVDEIFDASSLEIEVVERVGLIAQNSSWSQARSKAVVRMIAGGAANETEQTRRWFVDATHGADYREGIDAFRLKRRPSFQSR